jgi:ribonuclease P protein component
MIGRIVRSVDFERVLAAPSRARSLHFAVHHVHDGPSAPRRARATPDSPVSHELSTGSAPSKGMSVDDFSAVRVGSHVWLGAVVPKRHAKRAVTRSLLKRQIRAAVQRQKTLPGGLWVVRLRMPFARGAFASAASTALGNAARLELDALLADAVRRAAAG